MVCPKCGSTQAEGAKFCGVCGANLSTGEGHLTRQFNQNDVNELINAGNSVKVAPVKKERKKLNIPYKLILPVVAGALVIGGGAYFGLQYFSNKTNAEKYEANPFFLKNSDGYSALYSTDQERITDFIYDDVKKLEDGLYIVDNEDGTVDIINDNGEVIIDGQEDQYSFAKLNKYYLEKDSSWNSTYKRGSLIYNEDGTEIADNILIRSREVKNTNYIVMYNADTKVAKVILDDGTLLKEFSGIEPEDTISGSNNDDVFTLNINEKIYVFNVTEKAFKYALDLTGLESHSTDLGDYSVSISGFKNSVLISDYDYRDKKDNKYKYAYKYYVDGKVVKTAIEYHKSIYLNDTAIRFVDETYSTSSYLTYKGDSVSTSSEIEDYTYIQATEEKKYYFNEIDYAMDSDEGLIINKDGKDSSPYECFSLTSEELVVNEKLLVDVDNLAACRDFGDTNIIDTEGNPADFGEKIDDVMVNNEFNLVVIENNHGKEFLAKSSGKKLTDYYDDIYLHSGVAVGEIEDEEGNEIVDIYDNSGKKVLTIPAYYQVKVAAGLPYVLYTDGITEEQIKAIESLSYLDTDELDFDLEVTVYDVATRGSFKFKYNDYEDVTLGSNYIIFETENSYTYKSYSGKELYSE